MAYISFQPSDYFNTKLYTGNGSTNTAQTGVGFQPDWIWIKERSSTSSHILTDVVRGANKSLSSNLSGAESTETQSLISFDSDGFTVGSGGGVNENSQTYVAWNWKAGGSGSTNSDGSITSTVSANTTAGFSICKWTGTGSAGTIGHGLGAVPSMIIFKNLDGSTSRLWAVYHKGVYVSASDPNILYLNNTNAAADDTNVLGTSVTLSSSVFSVGDYTGTNASGEDIIAYCFAEKKGFSKFGSIDSNNSSDGVFEYLGFSPSFILIKDYINAGSNWVIHDNKRNTFNPIDKVLKPSANDAESTSTFCDFVSNGFKVRTAFNTSVKFLYMAFAEEPLVSSNGVPATAR